jgi:hypothetical protein
MPNGSTTAPHHPIGEGPQSYTTFDFQAVSTGNTLSINIPYNHSKKTYVEKPLMDKYGDMISPSRTDFLHNPSFEPSDENLEYHTFEDAHGDRLK